MAFELWSPSSKMAPRWPNVAPRCRQECSRQPQKQISKQYEKIIFWLLDCILAPRWPTVASRWPKMAPRWPKQAPRLPQDGHRWPRDAPRGLQDGPKMAQGCPKMSPRRSKTASLDTSKPNLCLNMLQEAPGETHVGPNLAPSPR